MLAYTYSRGNLWREWERDELRRGCFCPSCVYWDVDWTRSDSLILISNETRRARIENEAVEIFARGLSSVSRIYTDIPWFLYRRRILPARKCLVSIPGCRKPVPLRTRILSSRRRPDSRIPPRSRGPCPRQFFRPTRTSQSERDIWRVQLSIDQISSPKY